MKPEHFKYIAFTSILVLLFSTQVISGDREGVKRDASSMMTQIMESLSEEDIARIDSASRNRPAEKERGAVVREKELQVHNRLKDLPPEVKKQVERTIAEIESRREERGIQFREQLEQNRGTRD
ncbi:hypothetical protein QA601_14100 [Chitinispirillales bacterium ANBcel5]|uniref:hypothetical protein n=1 Tax=Cellulosispirillum alkaliphilum TaxID=3039283 RepID=UPI002A527B77|nr:hypothetical protein [Chitinispirillales bacterium ANBcel5]